MTVAYSLIVSPSSPSIIAVNMRAGMITSTNKRDIAMTPDSSMIFFLAIQYPTKETQKSIAMVSNTGWSASKKAVTERGIDWNRRADKDEAERRAMPFFDPN